MENKDGTNTLAKDLCKQRTQSEQTYTAPLGLAAGLERGNKISRTSHWLVSSVISI